MKRVYLEGRCRYCGMRVTVDRENGGHARDGRWCGPVETEHPFEVPDELPAPPLILGRASGPDRCPLTAS